MAQDVAAPVFDPGKVDTHPNNKPRKRDPKEKPVVKPSVDGIDGLDPIENLNVATTGELIRRLEKEIRINGPHSEAARMLKAALGKAYDAEPGGLKSKEELELIMRAASSRWPIMPATKRKIVHVLEKALRHEDPNVRMRAVRNATALERMNQIDEHEEQLSNVLPAEQVQPVQRIELTVVEQQRLRFSGIAERLGIDRTIIDVAATSPGSSAETTGEPSQPTGASNGFTSGLCNGHQPGEVANGKAPGHSQSGTNGHSNGSH